MKAWWICASKQKSGGGWDWSEFFERPGSAKKGYPWGGPGWIRSATSSKRIEKMRSGDIIVAYQAAVGVVGFVRLASGGMKSSESQRFDHFYLKQSGFVHLKVPVPMSVVRRLPDASKAFEFARSARGTVFAIDGVGLRQLQSLAGAFNPRQAAECRSV